MDNIRAAKSDLMGGHMIKIKKLTENCKFLRHLPVLG
jgi:hypothetical protein